MEKKQYSLSLFIFRRDLRIEDNIGLYNALTRSEKVVPLFIFDPQQLGDKNDYKSENSLQFMHESLRDLSSQIKKKNGQLLFFTGKPESVIKKIISAKKIDAIFVNNDYTPFSQKRDAIIKTICKKSKVDFISFDDALLNKPKDIKNKSNKPYAVFTPFMKNSKNIPVSLPKKYPAGSSLTSIKIIGSSTLPQKKFTKDNSSIWLHGGTTHAKKLILKLSNLKHYKNTRDFPEIMTSNLSAHNKFGTISIRSVYHEIKKKLGESSILLNQLYWRDFYYHVAYHNPHVFTSAYNKKYTNIPWSKNKTLFKKWSEGTTGFPIVDAAMKQLNSTGYMHNRCRMIVASFLTKDLHINWQWGEKKFANKLVDYDPCVNNGSWQWAASTGCDAQPYFRIFNPWTQQKKFDPNCTYIKKWLPELKEVPTKIIHKWDKYHASYPTDYPAPIIDHAIESKKTKIIFKKQL